MARPKGTRRSTKNVLNIDELDHNADWLRRPLPVGTHIVYHTTGDERATGVIIGYVAPDDDNPGFYRVLSALDGPETHVDRDDIIKIEYPRDSDS